MAFQTQKRLCGPAEQTGILRAMRQMTDLTCSNVCAEMLIGERTSFGRMAGEAVLIDFSHSYCLG